MKRARPNPRKVKIHRNYTVEEVALLFGIHKNTVRQWLKQGLPVCDQRRPTLILGRALADFLSAKRQRNRRQCEDDELYCLRCRAPRKPAEGMAEYQPVTERGGNLTAICPICNALMNKRMCHATMEQIRGHLDITFRPALKHIGDSSQHPLNSDFNHG